MDIRNLVVDGANQLEAHPGLFGVAFANSNGSIKESVVKNISFGQPRAPRVSGYPEGTGIIAGVEETGHGPGLYDVTIAGNTVTNYNYAGIYILGALPSNTDIMCNIVRNNQVVGSGSTNKFPQYGIHFYGNGRIENNMISNNFYTGTQYGGACGIDLDSVGDNQITGNTLINNEVGICADGTPNTTMNITLDNNPTSGPSAGASGYTGARLRYLNGYTVVLRNTAFSDLETGIRTTSGFTLQRSGNSFTHVTHTIITE